MNVRELVLRLLLEVEQGKKSHLALEDALARHPELSERDRRLLRRLVHGTLEERLLLDARINAKSKMPVEKMKPLIRQVLRMSAYQLFFLDKIPASAVINEAVKLVKKAHMQGLSGFVNGVLRAMARGTDWPQESEEARLGIPRWILEKWKREIGPEAALQAALALKKPERLTFRVAGETAEETLASLREEGAEVIPAPFPEGAYILNQVGDLTALSAFRQGRIRIQDNSSMLVGEVAAPAPGDLVLDVCAAPGGKSLHLAELLGGTGLVISCDVSESKVARIRENRERAGLSNLETRVQDARSFVPEWEEAFDVVLADLPCSGLGVMGRKPEIRYLVTPEEILALQRLQRTILRNVVRYVKPGGTLVYSTCTVTAEENGKNRSWILENLGLLPVDIREDLPELLRGEPTAAEGYLQLVPGVHPCDGFFLAKFRKPNS